MSAKMAANGFRTHAASRYKVLVQKNNTKINLNKAYSNKTIYYDI